MNIHVCPKTCNQTYMGIFPCLDLDNNVCTLKIVDKTLTKSIKSGSHEIKVLSQYFKINNIYTPARAIFSLIYFCAITSLKKRVEKQCKLSLNSIY